MYIKNFVLGILNEWAKTINNTTQGFAKLSIASAVTCLIFSKHGGFKFEVLFFIYNFEIESFVLFTFRLSLPETLFWL